MTMMQGVVRHFMIWYVPTVFVCSDKFVNTTNPQNVNDIGSILPMGKLLGVNNPIHLQISMPMKVQMKWMHVMVMLGKP